MLQPPCERPMNASCERPHPHPPPPQPTPRDQTGAPPKLSPPRLSLFGQFPRQSTMRTLLALLCLAGAIMATVTNSAQVSQNNIGSQTFNFLFPDAYSATLEAGGAAGIECAPA